MLIFRFDKPTTTNEKKDTTKKFLKKKLVRADMSRYFKNGKYTANDSITNGRKILQMILNQNISEQLFFYLDQIYIYIYKSVFSKYYYFIALTKLLIIIDWTFCIKNLVYRKIMLSSYIIII